MVEKQCRTFLGPYPHGGLRPILEVMFAERGRAARELVVEIDEERKEASFAVGTLEKTIAMPVEFLTDAISVKTQSLI